MTILEEVASQVDVVVIDSPPMLGVGDALTLSGLVDGILLVVRLDLIRKRTLAELHRVLWTSPAEKLGFVVADANGDHDYAHYAYSYERSFHSPKSKRATRLCGERSGHPMPRPAHEGPGLRVRLRAWTGF